jgi:PAS domain S-box-containing protein
VAYALTKRQFFIVTPKPSCESARLEALYCYEILDTLSDPAFDDLARLATYTCRTPIAVISFVDAERQWFKSTVGLDHKETPRETAFCSHTILGTDSFIVEETDTDERFKDHPWVIGPPALRFYTGVPLLSPDGYAIGSLAVMDVVPRILSPEQRACLRTIANQIMAQLELRRPPRLDSRQERDHRKESEYQLQKILDRTAHHAGSAYFAALVQEIATATGVDHAFCARVLPGGTRAQTMALWSGGAAQPNFDYDLAGTPCEQVSDGALCHYPTGVQTLFPDDTLLQQMGIESYMGVPLLGSRGTPVGWISIMGAGTIQAPTRAEAILRLCGGRASSELERMEAEVARQKSQQLLENIVENIPLAVFVKDPEDEFRIRLWNQAAESIFGIPRTDMLGRNAHDLWPKQQADSDLTDDQRCIAEGVAQDIAEEPGISQERGDIALHTRKVPFFDEAGKATHLLTLCEDITDRKRTEEERSKQELLVSLMLSTGPGCIKRVALDGTLLHMNPAGLAMIEACREEDAIGLSVFDLVLPEHRAAFMSMHQDVISGASRILQFEIQGLQGSRRWMETHAAPFRNPVTGGTEHLAVTHDITERKQAEEALKQSEERYRVLYDDTPTMYFTLATDGTVRSVNRFGSTQLLYQAEELIGHSVLDIFHEEDKETVAASLSECLTTPEITRHWEFRKVRKDGSIIWVQETAHVSRSSSGETVVLVTCEDVTERKRTEQALTFFRTLLDYVDDSIEIIDPQTGQFLDGNKGAASNLGYTRDELLTLTVPDIDPLVTGPVFAGLMEQLKDTPNPMILDSLHRRKDGTTFPVEVSAQLIRLDKDYLVAVVRDSTERKRMEEALRSSEERFRLVTEATQDVLWDWDLSANTRWWSPNAQDKFGCDLNGMPDNKAWVSRLHPDDLDRIFAQVQDTLTSELHMFSGEYRFRLADGSYGHFYDRAYIMRDGSGKPTRMIGAMIDVTGVKQAYASLQEAYRRLQSMANELQTVESNERRRLSRELHDEVGQLLAALKFDLESVRRKGIGKRKLSPIQVTERLTRALETTDLLFSRLRQIVRALRPQVLEELGLKAALESLTADVQARTGLACSAVVEGDTHQPGLASTRETALYRIAQELLTNVIRHAQAKTASISLTLGPDHWILTVEDDGIGFDPTTLPLTGGVGLRGIRERVEIPVIADPTSPTARKPRLTPSTRRRGREQAL